MNTRPPSFSRFMWLALVLTALCWGVGLTAAAGAPLCGLNGTQASSCLGFNPNVDYTIANFAYSPNLRKFVNSLPGLGSANANNIGQYIPIATPDTATFPGADYYELGISQYSERMHSDLPATGTMLRGYYQINGPDTSKHYLGPLIIAHRDRPVRVKYFNNLQIGSAGNLPLPVDTTIMGAGAFIGTAFGTGNFTQNRANIHLHGGATPWISDGTPDQWITPAGETTIATYYKGLAFQNVPDMVTNGTVPCIGGATCFLPTANDGIGTLYYTNQQSGRLMFYHDHAYGITRLNVYDGLAAPYLLVDQVEEDLISGTNVSGVFGVGAPGTQILPDLGGVYHYGIPLVIQDKTFVNDASTPPGLGFTGTPTHATLTDDPRWALVFGVTPVPTGGNLWLPHEYMPNEDIYSNSGFNVRGRWDYGPFLVPPATVNFKTLPTPTIVPEAFMDTTIINGTAFPYLNLPPTPVRFRILNACDDRTLNLQLYYAATAAGVLCKGPNSPAANLCTEVSMVKASPNPAFPSWPTDGRPGGVPDPTTAGPDFIQIGAEGGLLVKPAIWPQQPVDFDYNRRSITFGDVLSWTLLMMPAMRTDVVVDFSSVPSGSTLILYNDAPAPMPGHDDRNDFYTNDPDQTAIGGAPSTPAGFGPNTRTLMQIRIAGPATAPFNLSALQSIMPTAFALDQDTPVVNSSAFGGADNFANSIQDTLNISGGLSPVLRVLATLPGLGYTSAPAVSFIGGGGSGAAATASLDGLGGIAIIAAGTGYTTAPAITITAQAGVTTATATATVSGGQVTAISITDPGSGYNTTNFVPPLLPVITIGGPGTGASAQATITNGTVGHITVTSGGSYTQAPQVLLTGGGGTGAGASAILTADLVMTGKNLTEGFDKDYGRMNIMLGSTPNALSPAVGAGPVVGLAQYIDPPTEIINNQEPILWRISHLGADSHAMHFHLFNLQVVNRVDYTNTVKRPYDDELGWRETIRTNPFEDVIVAIRPYSMALPFPLPRSNRLLDPTTALNSTTNFLPVAPPVGVPAVSQITNITTDFGWEYVWHCHLLSHEENDMMRPMVFNPPTAAPPASVLAVPTQSVQQVNLSWTNSGALTNAPAGYVIQRQTGGGAFTNLATIGKLSYADTSVAPSTSYTYRIQAVNDASTVASGVASLSNVQTITTPAAVIPTMPTAIRPIGNGILSSAPFVFSAVPGATNYTISLTDVTAGTAAVNTNFTALQAGCDSGTGNCSFTMGTPLVHTNSYTWSVVASNTGGGTGPASATLSFFVSTLFAPIPANIGIFTNGTWYLDMNGNGIWDGSSVDTLIPNFGQGLPNAIPVTGDWNGTGNAKVGVFSNGTWYLDMNGNGVWDGPNVDKLIPNFGQGLPNAIPVTGDWNGTGTAKVGVFSNGTWYLDLNGNGVWDGSSTDKVILNFGQGLPNAIPVTGDWTNTGVTRVGVFSNGIWYLDILGNGIWDGGVTDITIPDFGKGVNGAQPIVLKKK